MTEKVICAECMTELKPNGRYKRVKALEAQHTKLTGHDTFQEYDEPLKFKRR